MMEWLKYKLEKLVFSKFWLNSIVTMLVLGLVVSGGVLLIKQFQERRYIAEVNAYRKVVTKYKLAEDSPWNDLSQAPVISEDKFGFENSDEYFDLVAKEYAIEDFAYWDKQDTNGTLKIGREESGTVPASVENPLTFDTDLVQLSGDLKDLRTLRRFSGLSDDDSRDEPFKDEDEIALSLDAETVALDLDVYFDEKYIRHPETGSALLKKTQHNSFYTSPQPDPLTVNTRSTLDDLRLILDKDHYYSYDLVRMNLVAPTNIKLDDFRVFVRRGQYLIPNVGGKHDIFFKYRNRTIYTSASLGYHPSPGVYHIMVRSISDPTWVGIEKSFVLKRRKVAQAAPGFGVINLEYTNPLKNKKIIRPTGVYGDYRALLEWVNYMEGDALWMLAAQTVGWDSAITPEKPWKASGLGNLELLAPVAQDENILLGAYIMSYYTPGNGKKKAGYQPSLGYTGKTDSLLDTRHISLADKKRYQDILNMAIALEKNPYVDYIGFDFIRTGQADGYELAPQFINDMNVHAPQDFSTYPRTQQTLWLARRLENQANKTLILKWRWWRAHTVASIIHSVIVDGKITKPVWVFTLGWRHGQEHGQDPNMFFDAGVTMDAVMLYEANRRQFANLMKQWNYYMRNNQNNILIGNAVDTRFLDSSHGVYAIEYVHRTKEGYRNIYREGFAKGIFIHDLSRALWSSKRGYHVSEWAIIHGHSLSAFRQETGVIPYQASMRLSDDSSQKYSGTITVTNTSDTHLDDLSVTFSPTPSWLEIIDDVPASFSLPPNAELKFSFHAKPAPKAAKGKKTQNHPLIGYYLDSPDHAKYFFFTIPETTQQLQNLLTYKQ